MSDGIHKLLLHMVRQRSVSKRRQLSVYSITKFLGMFQVHWLRLYVRLAMATARLMKWLAPRDFDSAIKTPLQRDCLWMKTSVAKTIFEATFHEAPRMSDQSRPDAVSDDFDRAARINFRDYPGSALVAIAAVTSGLAWLLYKRRGRKDAAQRASPDDVAESKGSALQMKPQAE